MHILNYHRWIGAALIAVAVTMPSQAAAQGISPGRANPDGSMFKMKKRETQEVHGPSLAATDEPVVEIRIVGNKTIPTSQILDQLQTRVGRPFDPMLVQRDIRKLASQSWFVAIDPLYEKTPAGRIVILKVVERPTIRYVEYLGNKGIRDKKLNKETGLKLGGSVDPFAIEEARRKIEALYQRNGFNEAQVTILEGNKATDQGVVFVINEGKAQRIWKVEFVGNTFVSGKRLKTQIESKPPIMYFFKGFVDRDVIDGDVDRLTAYYRAFGFFQAKVGRKLEFNEKGNWMTLTYVVHEGPRYDVRNVSFMGNELFADTSLAIGTKLASGQPFEQAKMNDDVEWLKEVYGSQGYIFADVRAEPVFLEEPGKIDLVYHMEEGKRWRVGRIFVHIGGEGPHTRIQTALNRLSLRPGEIVDIREVKASERRLQASSLFLTDPVRGVSPKITYRIRELGDEEIATGASESTFRGQSPDNQAASSQQHTTNYPPGTYVIEPPAGFVPRDDDVDVHLQIDETRPAGGAAPATENASARSSGNPYQRLVVRTQSPYQLPTTQPAQQPAGAVPAYYQATPAAGGSPIVQDYNSTTYGGRAVGATGPDAAPVGGGAANGVRQAQATGVMPPPQGYGPAFGPPPMGPEPVLLPNAAIAPIPGDPRIFPNGPVDPFLPQYDDPAVDMFVDLNEAQTGRFMVGVAVNSDAGLVGQVLLDEQNFDWKRYPTSIDDFTSGRAWRGAGQRMRVEAAPGTEVQRYLASFQEPYLWDTPVSFGLSGSFFDRRYLDWDEQRLGGRVSLGYGWTENDLSAAVAYRGENVNIRNPSTNTVQQLNEVVGDTVLHGFRVTVANDTRNNPFLATEGHYAEVSLEQVIGSFQYPRAIIDLRSYGLLSERPDHSGRHVLSYSTKVGFSGNDTPIYEAFFAGGFSTLRGFDFRGASPVINGVQVGGDFMWINTLEYLFPLTADDMMHGVVFVDYGTVTPNVSLDDFRVSPGLGLRITVPAMGPMPIALDFAWPVARADTDQLQVFSFNIGLQR
jgi:outer membrane protein insertion porin family